MKTNASAAWIRKLRVVALSLAIAAIAGVEYRVGESLASRFGQVTVCPSDSPQAPSVGLADMMAAGH